MASSFKASCQFWMLFSIARSEIHHKRNIKLRGIGFATILVDICTTILIAEVVYLLAMVREIHHYSIAIFKHPDDTIYHKVVVERSI